MRATCARRSQHVGTVHSSNLCTEITLNTSDTEIAVCNLGSVNMLAHMVKTDAGRTRWELDHEKLKRTIPTAMRMLDNVIDINYYAVAKARNSNLKHRPVGLGIMGFQDCLHLTRTPYASNAAVEFADRSMEAVCYYAYYASTELAEERGRYSSYAGSLWDRGLLPQDTLKLLKDERGGYVEIDESSGMDWDPLRARIKEHGMRNSNCIAIAPTATISNIIGVAASIEPEYQNIYVKSNLSGEFTVVNEQLVRDLKAIGQWDEVMVADLKYFDGSLAKIDRVPAEMRELYATAFEVETKWIVEAGARRQKWIDQAQSLNIYMAGASGKKLDETYKLAWVRGLKTTYYLRTLAATSAEKSTGRGGELNAVNSSGGAQVGGGMAAGKSASGGSAGVSAAKLDDEPLAEAVPRSTTRLAKRANEALAGFQPTRDRYRLSPEKTQPALLLKRTTHERYQEGTPVSKRTFVGAIGATSDRYAWHGAQEDVRMTIKHASSWSSSFRGEDSEMRVFGMGMLQRVVKRVTAFVFRPRPGGIGRSRTGGAQFSAPQLMTEAMLPRRPGVYAIQVQNWWGRMKPIHFGDERRTCTRS